MEEKQQFLDNEGLIQFHHLLNNDIDKKTNDKIDSRTSQFISYTDDTEYEALEEVT